MNIQQPLFAKRLTLVLLMLLTLSSAFALAQQSPALPIPAPPQLAGFAWVLMDAKSGHLLVSKHADKRYSPASLTKLMTAYIATQEIDTGQISEQDKVRISEKAWRTGGSKMFIEVGKQVSISDLLHGIIIQSGNDASIALAEHIAGSEETFADLMNQRAQKLGLQNTHFKNSTGLPPPEEKGMEVKDPANPPPFVHYSSAHDLALLARAIIFENATHYRLYSQKEFVFNGIKQPNRNLLLWQDSSVDGLKTGHTEAAGYCLVASAVRDDTRLIAVLLGSKNERVRAAEVQKLLTYGFRFFETKNLHPAGKALAQVRVWKGTADKVSAGLAQDLALSLPKGHANALSEQLQLDDNLIAPIEKGQKIGTLSLSLDAAPLKSVDLIALEAVESGGFLRRLWDSTLLFFRGLFN